MRDFTTSTMPVPARCACRAGIRLCLVAERLRRKLDVEFELGVETGNWSHHAAVLEEARAHVARMDAS